MPNQRFETPGWVQAVAAFVSSAFSQKVRLPWRKQMGDS